MKTLTLLFTLLSVTVFSQVYYIDNNHMLREIDTTKYANKNIYLPHRIDSALCQERGHISSGLIMATAMYCPPYYIDTDTTTVIVYPACNTETFTCQRCGKQVIQKEEERRVVIWRKDK